MAPTPTGPSDKSGSAALAAVLRHRWRVLAAGIVLAALGYILPAAVLTETYQATAVITLSKDRPFDPATTNAESLGDPSKWATLQAAKVTSTLVLQRAQANLPADVRDDVAEMRTFRRTLEVEPLNESNQITVTATAGSPAEAAVVANAVAEAYEQISREGVTTTAAAALAAVSSDPAQRQLVELNATSYGSGVGALDSAEEPLGPSGPKPWQMGLLGGLVGLLGAAGVAAWAAHLKHRVQPSPLPGVAELGRWTAAPVTRSLGEADSPAARSAGVVLVGLQHLGHLRSPRLEVGSILVTAAAGEAGGLAVGLGAAAAREGRRVVLVDADDSAGGSLAALGAPLETDAPASLPDSRWLGALRTWNLGGGAVVDVLRIDVRASRAHSVSAGLRHLVEEGYFVVVVGDSITRSPIAFAIAGDVDAVLVQVEPEPRAEVVARTLAQLSIAAPAVVAQVVVEGAERSTLPLPVRTQQAAAPLEEAAIGAGRRQGAARS